MCGIAGILEPGGAGEDELQAHIEAMTAALRHRGPDDAGTYVDPAAGVALGSRRLAVVDLSRHGHQPMVCAQRRHVLAFNGEIYNYRDLRRELEHEGARFGGSSDTEVLLGAICRWGLRDALVRCNGMFAVALWDTTERCLQLARDRFGEKPLYYGWANGALLVGSELKAIRANPAFHADVDADALALYFRHNCIPAPYTIYRGFAKLPPATIVTFDRTATAGTLPPPVPYWSLADVVAEGRLARAQSAPSLEACLDDLDAVLRSAVGLRLHADVALGAFLSGGIDSSLVVALMQAQSAHRVRTFTVALAEHGYDESASAREVASHLGTDHTELLVTPRDALDVVPRLPAMYDEPFADSSQIPTALLAALTRRHVTVALSGDGGDELFGGYNRYAYADRFWHRVARVPLPLRRHAGRIASAVPPTWWDRLYARAGPVLPAAWRVRMPSTKVAKAARVLPAADLHDTYRRLTSHMADPATLVPNTHEPPTVLTDLDRWPSVDEPVELMMYLDTVSYLPDDILTKLDRATMAASLEARVPLLDPAVASWAWRLPLELKVHRGSGKWLLRRLLHRYVPAQLVERPKMGFGIPLSDWLRGPLRPWAEELLDAHRLRRDGYLAAGEIRRMWEEHLSGRRDHEALLWNALMFGAWLESARPAAETATPRSTAGGHPA